MLYGRRSRAPASSLHRSTPPPTNRASVLLEEILLCLDIVNPIGFDNTYAATPRCEWGDAGLSGATSYQGIPGIICMHMPATTCISRSPRGLPGLVFGLRLCRPCEVHRLTVRVTLSSRLSCWNMHMHMHALPTEKHTTTTLLMRPCIYTSNRFKTGTICSAYLESHKPSATNMTCAGIISHIGSGPGSDCQTLVERSRPAWPHRAGRAGFPGRKWLCSSFIDAHGSAHGLQLE
jgi:hypothetical protein